MDITAEYATEVRETLNSLADVNRGKILHLVVPSSEDSVIEYFGFKGSDLPKVVIADLRKEGAGMRKYHFEGIQASLEDLTQFEQDFLDGALTPNLKSQD